jgi:hypothetical protein
MEWEEPRPIATVSQAKRGGAGWAPVKDRFRHTFGIAFRDFKRFEYDSSLDLERLAKKR